MGKYIHKFYALLLRLLPRSYRQEYGDELQTVFSLSVKDALKTGKLETTRMVLREPASIPKAIFFEHLRGRKGEWGGRFLPHLEFVPGSRSEILAALAPLLIWWGLRC